MFPTVGASDVCPDTPLRIVFASTPIIGTGKVKVFDAANNNLIETIDVSVPTRTKTIGGLANYNYYPVIISGNQASLYLPNISLAYDKTYYITIDAGAFKNSNGKTFAGLSGAQAWRFSTKAAPPLAGVKKLTVAADGTADFATVQSALDFVPEGNTAQITIFIRIGIYNEIIFFTSKNNITILGEDRKRTIIAYANNERFNNNAGGNPFAAGAASPSSASLHSGAIYRRAVFLAHRVTDLTITNLTLHNTTAQGGSQAEAIILNGTPTARAIITGVDLYSFQDTLQINGQAYVSDCYIEGDVDFMWGTGPCFFENCEARALRSNAYYTQIRNPATNHGYVYKHCTFAGAPGITGNFLSRVAPSRFPASEVVLIDCVLTDAVGAVAWQLDQAPGATPGSIIEAATGVHYWEFESHDPAGKPVDMSRRLAIARRLKLPEDREIVANYSDPRFVLGGQWTPVLAPIITTQPVAVTESEGRMATFSVSVAAVPAPTYQWQKNGRNIGGATQSEYKIERANREDAGRYAAVISNTAGKVTSAPATLTITSRKHQSR
jgi:pectin methylesterase-like acyl-CoA thioesterase